MDPTPNKWYSGWLKWLARVVSRCRKWCSSRREWLTGAISRWCNRYRTSHAERRLTTENAALLDRIKALELEVEQTARDLESATAEAKAQKELAEFLEEIVTRQRLQVEAEMAVTARQIAKGEVHGTVR